MWIISHRYHGDHNSTELGRQHAEDEVALGKHGEVIISNLV